MDNIMDKINEMLSDPESLKQIQELADMLNSSASADGTQGSTSTPTNEPPMDTTPTNDIDFTKVFQLMQMVNSSANSQDTTLLLAIKPYLTDERQNKVDKAIRLMKAYDIFMSAKSSGLLSSLDGLL